MKGLPKPPKYVRVGCLAAAVTASVSTIGLYLLHNDLLMGPRASDSRVIIGLAVLVFVCTTAVGVAVALAWRHRQRIRAVVAAAERLAAGETPAWLPVGDDEDVGQLTRAFERLQDRLRDTTVSRDYLDTVLGSMQDAIVLLDAEGHVTRANQAACKLLGYTEQDLTRRSAGELIAPGAASLLSSEPRPGTQAETTLLTRTGKQVPVSYTRSPIAAAGSSPAGWIIAARDITERKLADRRIRYLARIDALTKVPNRMQFQHLLQRAIARARRSGERIALLYLDVDRFKDINDTFGHMAGDTSLETLARRVTNILPERAFMGRLAGDEFGIVVFSSQPAATRTAWLQSLARRILHDISEVLIVQGQELYITASIGIACFPNDADNVLDLIRNADAALYHAKREGGNRLEFYRPEMNAAAVERLILKSKLRRSYELDELLVNYQPKIDLATGRIAGAEALVRWELSEHGLIQPSEFIPLAEETGLILEIGEWVLNRVCLDLAQWRREIGPPGTLSVNLSLKQLAQPNFIRRIKRIFRRHRIEPGNIEFEITETTLMQDPDRTTGILQELSRMGLHLAIDDFGTGYSSLSALQKFPIDTLKIDQSFVRDAATDADDATIVATIIDMAHSMNMKVVAEGVESEDQLAFLRTLDCDYVQGMLFGQPMTADEYAALLLDQREGTGSYRTLFG